MKSHCFKMFEQTFSFTKRDILALNSFSTASATLDLLQIKIYMIISSCTYSMKRHIHTVQNSVSKGNKVALSVRRDCRK